MICRMLAIAGMLIASSAFSKPVPPTVVVVVGAAGQEQFGERFARQAELWRQSAEQGQANLIQIGLAPASDATDRDTLKRVLEQQPVDNAGPLWLVLIGHGTFDGREARFNLRGPDVSASDLKEWLALIGRPVILINTASASAPFLNQLSATNRVIVTATRSGNEFSFTYFGGFFAEALGDRQSDLDQDDQVSVLEAFLTASSRVDEFYRMEGRLASEHALLDDNGDGRGTPADWFRGVRAVKRAQEEAPVDGARAQQMHLVLSPAERALPAETRARRDALELQLAGLRGRKLEFSEEEYYRRLEQLLLELARLYVPAAPPGN